MEEVGSEEPLTHNAEEEEDGEEVEEAVCPLESVTSWREVRPMLHHTSHVYMIPAFTWTLSLGIILGQVIIQPITSLLTLLKGILLVITVSVTFVVGSEVHQETTNDFTQIGKPFLMGTVALGGIVNVMPFSFSEISHVKTQVLWFRRAVLGDLPHAHS
ncbi:hypothetical protein F2P79_020579 [Pimephales promelas]|nr:hypothetical protein F2P79_020579 [Pimephales promelas]